jgi:hypothetical protein
MDDESKGRKRELSDVKERHRPHAGKWNCENGCGGMRADEYPGESLNPATFK